MEVSYMVQKKELTDYIKAGKKIQAVKFVRDYKEFSLKDAKDYVDELERTIKKVWTPDGEERKETPDV